MVAAGDLSKDVAGQLMEKLNAEVKTATLQIS